MIFISAMRGDISRTNSTAVDDVAMQDRYYENEYAEFWIENNVLFFIYKRDIVMNLLAAKTVVADRLKLQQGKSYPVFCDMRGIRDTEKPARDYLAKEGSELVDAVAVLIDSPVTRIMVNFYLNLSKPVTPTKMFTSKEDALEYLQATGKLRK